MPALTIFPPDLSERKCYLHKTNASKNHINCKLNFLRYSIYIQLPVGVIAVESTGGNNLNRHLPAQS